MFHSNITFNGRLAVFGLEYLGQRAVTASGYLLTEEGQARLYVVSVVEARLTPPRQLVHVAMARFAKELGATHLVAVDHEMQSVPGRLRPDAFAGGFVPALPAVTLDLLEQKLERVIPA
jgi:hypothetical protein